jgi:hypothetical protein
MADTLRIGRKGANDEVTRVPNGDSADEGKGPPEAIENGDRSADCYRLQVFTPPAVDGNALWGTFGADGHDDTPAPTDASMDAPTRRVRYVRSMRRPVLAVATGAIAAVVFLLSLWVYTRVRAPVGNGEAAPALTTSSPALAVSSAATTTTATPQATPTTATPAAAPEPTRETPDVRVEPTPTARPDATSTRNGGRTSAPPPPDASPPATVTQPVPTPSGMMIPDPPY